MVAPVVAHLWNRLFSGLFRDILSPFQAGCCGFESHRPLFTIFFSTTWPARAFSRSTLVG